MDAIIARIKEIALIINSELKDDSFLDYVVGSVVDRALIYTNRIQLIHSYEWHLEHPEDEELDHEHVAVPIPAQLERVLAQVVVELHKSIQTRSTATTGAVKSISDNGQSISYSDNMASFLASSGDAEIFSGSLELLNKFRLANVHHADTRYVQDCNRRRVL